MTGQKVSGLWQLPAECLEGILRELDVQSIKNLRLANKALSQRCLGPYFKSFLEAQSTDLTPASLQSLSELAAHDLGRCVKRLVLTAVIYDTTELEEVLESGRRRETTYSGPIVQQTFAECTSDELAQVRSDVAWLTSQRAQQANDSDSVLDRLTAVMTRLHRLESLKLDGAVMCAPGVAADTFQGDVREIWAQASRIFLLVMKAAAQSNMVIDSLDLFRNTPRCGVFVKDLAVISGSWRGGSKPPSFATVKSLAITIGLDFDHNNEERAAAGGQNRENDDDQEAAGSSNEYPALADFLRAMPNLEGIDLHIYRTRPGDVDALRMTVQAFAKLTYLRSLQRCSLAGAFVDEQSLQQFLHRHSSIRRLELVELRLGEHGNWRTILSSIRADLTELQSLRLSSLWASRLMNLEPVWESAVLREKMREWSFRILGPVEWFTR